MHHHPDTLIATNLAAHRRRTALAAAPVAGARHPVRPSAVRARVGALLIDAGERLAASARPARPLPR